MPNLVWVLPGLDPGCKFCFGSSYICPMLVKLAMCSRTCSSGPAGIPETGESNSVFIDGCYLGPSVTDQIFYLECIGPLWASFGVPFDQFGFPLSPPLSCWGSMGLERTFWVHFGRCVNLSESLSPLWYLWDALVPSWTSL